MYVPCNHILKSAVEAWEARAAMPRMSLIFLNWRSKVRAQKLGGAQHKLRESTQELFLLIIAGATSCD